MGSQVTCLGVETDRKSETLNGFVEVDGLRVHYVRRGSGPALLLVHGLTGSTGNWRKNLESFSQDACVYALDLNNMGQSQRMAGLDAGLSATADRVARFMDAVGIDLADVAGHSHGGAVVLMLAARHTPRVRRLILFAPANPYCERARWLIRFYLTPVGALLARTVPYLPRSVHQFALGRMYGDPARITEGTVEGYTDGLSVPGTIAHVLEILRLWSGDMARLGEALPKVAETPVLLVWGDRDTAVGPESAAHLMRRLPLTELELVPGAGHVPFEEMPVECNALVQEWLQRNSTVPLQPASV